MWVRKSVNYLILIISLAILTGILIVDLFSTQSIVLSNIKSNSDYSIYLFLNKDLYQNHLSIMGWKIGYPTNFIPLEVLYLLFGLVSTGFYPSVLVLISIVILFFLTTFWLLNLLFADNLRSKWHASIFIILMMALLGTNTPILTIFPAAHHHGGTILISFLFIALVIYYLKTFKTSILILLSILNILFIYSDLLYVVSCALPFAITFMIIKFIERKFDRRLAIFLYALAVSTLIGLLCASYLRFSNYSSHAILITAALSLVFACFLLPLLLLPELMDWVNKNWRAFKLLIYIIMSLGIITFIYVLFSHSVHNFVRLFFYKKIHFRLAGNIATISNNNFFDVTKAMLHLMIFGKPFEITIWFKLFLLIPLLACAYLLIPNKYKEKIIPQQYGRMIAWFLMVSTIIVFFSNLFSVGLKPFSIQEPNSNYNLRYFVIPLFFGLFIIGFAFVNVMTQWARATLAFAVTVVSILFIYPQFSTLNFSAYANTNLYNDSLNSEVACLLKANKKYHLHYGLGHYFLALAVDNYLPKNIFINSIVPSGKILNSANNVYWYVYNPNTRQMPIYNFIVTGSFGENNANLVKLYGTPSKIISCGDNIHLWVYQQPSAVKQFSDAVFQQVANEPLVIQFLRTHHLSFH